jgi:hypothetical protein
MKTDSDYCMEWGVDLILLKHVETIKSTEVYNTPRCIQCGQSSKVLVRTEDLEAWKSGSLIQNVWPEATPDERELIKLGTHAKCWDEMFGVEHG